MKTTYFITGTSKGLGKALAGFLLQENSNQVYGYARSGSEIQKENYIHTQVDLSDGQNLANFMFPEVDTDRMVLVNNAGLIHPINRVGQQDFSSLQKQMNVNVLATLQLCNKFIEQFKSKGKQLIILNISSGAAKSAIDGWSSYCASKAAVDIYSETLQIELNLEGIQAKVLSVSPGVVDTPMQKEIRAADDAQFSRLQHFQGLKHNEELASPEAVSFKIAWLLDNYERIEGVQVALRDVKV